MECWSKLIFLLLTVPAFGQYVGHISRSSNRSIVVVETVVLSSNSSSTGIVSAPSRKSLGNCANNCTTGGVLQPVGQPLGQFYCTTAAQSAGVTNSCTSMGVVSETASGTGLTAFNNGNGAGGVDSPVTVTDQYGLSTSDSVCTSDPNQALPTLYAGLPPAPCVANASATFAQSTATSHGNSDVLWPSDYASNSTILDSVTNYYRDIYWCVDNLSTLHDWEMDVNLNSSPTAYSGGTGAYWGAGFDWGGTSQMFRACPQNCTAWTVLKGHDLAGGSDLTSFPLTNGHCYRTRNYGHRNPGCTFSSSSNCFFYDYLTVYDVTTQTPPQFQSLLTNNTDYSCVGALPCSTWPMPTIPTAGSNYVDPTWGTTQYRLAINGNNGSNQVIPCYSRVQQWNQDNTKMMMVDMQGDAVDLYDATTTPPTPINKITTTFASAYPDCADNDSYFGNTPADNNIIFFQGSSGSAYGLSLLSVDISGCATYPGSCNLTPTVIHTFSCSTDAISDPELGTGVAGNKIETGSGGQGGLFDATDTYFTFSCDRIDGAGTHKIDVITYNKTTDTIISQKKWYTLCPGGQPVGCSAYWYALQTGKNLFRMAEHPNGMNSILWQSGSSNGTSGTSGAPTNISISGGVATVTASSVTLKNGTEAKFHNIVPTSLGTYFNNYFGIVSNATGTSFQVPAPSGAPTGSTAVTGGTITGLSCSLDVNWVQGCGIEIFDKNWTYLGAAAAYSAHQDTGYDINGNPVIVEVGSHRNDTPDSRALGISNLLTLSKTAVNQTRVLLPCNYDRTGGCGTGILLNSKSGASHVSCTASSILKGFCLVSTMMNAGPNIPQLPEYPTATTLGTAVSPGTVTVTPASMSQIGVGVVSTIDTGTNMEAVTWTAVTGTTATAVFTKTHTSSASVMCLSCGDTGFAAMENIAVRIDATAADSSNVSFWRLGRTMAIRDNTYDAEPHTTVNRDFTQFVWGSTWNFDPVDATSVNGYWMKLAAGGSPTAPHTYSLVDASTGLPVGGIPVDHHTWTSGPDVQVQIDMTTANASTQIRVISDTTTYFQIH
jgi:hypothetical protein